MEGLQDDLELRGNINCAELKESVDSVLRSFEIITITSKA